MLNSQENNCPLKHDDKTFENYKKKKKTRKGKERRGRYNPKCYWPDTNTKNIFLYFFIVNFFLYIGFICTYIVHLNII